IHAGLRAQVPAAALTRYGKQRGMFPYAGLTEAQVECLREQHGGYVLRAGRMCVAGLNEAHGGIVADAIGAVLASGV
ncbi:aminotransferase class I/II-fold pyridoxal phosphate-dependent enzyme, partial [Burkholderia pseudomallei]